MPIYEIHTSGGGGTFVGDMNTSYTYSWTGASPPDVSVTDDLAGFAGGTYRDMAITQAGQVVVGTKGRIYYRPSGNPTYTLPASQTLETFLSVAASGNHVLAVGYLGTIVYSSNGGDTWVKRSQEIRSFLNDVYFTNSSTGIAIGDHGTILRTTNAGDQWTQITSPGRHALYGIDFADASNGYIVGDNGAILRTFDGGSTWMSLSSSVRQDLKSIAVDPSNSQVAVAVGVNGTIVRTSDGGTTWQKLASGAGQAIDLTTAQCAQFSRTTLYDVRFRDDGSLGYAVGSYGTILSTTNHGINWDVDVTWDGTNTPVRDRSTYYRSIGFEGSNDVPFVVGYQYRPPNHLCPSLDGDLFYSNETIHNETGTTIGIYRTNVSQNWADEQCGSMGWFYDVDFPTTSKGYAASFDGTLYRITRIGSAYKLTALQAHTRWSLRGVFFVDGTTGYAVGAQGTIVKTTDGGIIWHKQYGAAEPEELASSGEEDITPNLQVHPNPLQSQTNIRYTLAQEQAVTLQVQDLYGRVVAVLIDNRLQKSGQYSIEFDGADLASGTYFCTLQTPSFTTTPANSDCEVISPAYFVSCSASERKHIARPMEEAQVVSRLSRDQFGNNSMGLAFLLYRADSF